MEQYSTKIIGSALIFLLILFSGLFLRFRGKPYNKLVLGLHKIAALASICITILLLISILNKNPDHQFRIMVVLISVVAGLICFVSGVLQSFENAAPKAVVLSHKISSYFIILFILYIIIPYY